MSSTYYDATGVLVLDKVTPVIIALFGAFNLDGTYPGGGQAYIARISENNNTSWGTVLEGMVELTKDLGLKLQENAEETIEDYLHLLSTHFGVEKDEVLGNLIERNSFENDADIDALFDIATRFDDGHGLKALKLEGCWHCSKPRLFEFGGNGEYYGRNVFVTDSSNCVVSFGADLDQAIEESDLDKGADHLLRKINGILAGVSKTEVREALQTKLCERLVALQGAAETDSSITSVPVANWNSNAYGGDHDTGGKKFAIEINDQRKSHGQLFVDITGDKNKPDDILTVSLEVHRLPDSDTDTQCVHLHFDDDRLAASFFKQGNKLIVRPETGVTITDMKLPNGECAWILADPDYEGDGV